MALHIAMLGLGAGGGGLRALGGDWVLHGHSRAIKSFSLGNLARPQYLKLVSVCSDCRSIQHV